MSFIAPLRAQWNAILRRQRTQQDVEAELAFHLEAHAEGLIARGVPSQEARRQARIAVGNPQTQNEKYRRAIGLRLFDELSADLRYGFRGLIRNPGFSCIAILSLAIGIGATTAIFSLIYAVLLHPFPYKDANRIMNPVVINQHHPNIPTWFSTNGAQLESLRKAHCVSSVLGFRPGQMEITGSNIPEGIFAIYLTGNAGKFFGVAPRLGQGLDAFRTRSHQPLVVLNYRFWQRHYGGSPAILGHTLQLNHHNYTIIGVMPRSFAFIDTGIADVYLLRNLRNSNAQLWLPWIRLKKGILPTTADQELDPIIHRFAHQDPHRYPKQFRVKLQPILALFAQHTGHTLSLLFAGVLFLLLIGCANCSILLLARGATRTHELSIRAALGAGRWRIIRQLLVESSILAFTGATLGAAASYWLARLPLQLSPASFPAESIIRVNLPVLALCIALAFSSTLLFGLAPALHFSRPQAPTAPSSASRSFTRSHRGLHILIASQVAITLLLLATAGMAMRSFLNVTQAPLGCNPKNVLQIGIMMHFRDPKEWKHLQSHNHRTAYLEQIRTSIAQLPGVVSAAIGTNATPPNSGGDEKVEISQSSQAQPVRVMSVGTHYFQTLRIPLLRGRVWNSIQNSTGDGVAIVNQSFALHYLSGKNPLGQEIRIPTLKANIPIMAASSQSSGWRQIVAVVANVRNNGLGSPVLPAVYVPYSTLMPPYAGLQIRTRTAPLPFLPAVRKAVAAVSSDQQVSRGAHDLEHVIRSDPQWRRQRLFSVLFGAFSAMALLLSLVGLFSVVSFSVARRTTEFGIRMALGAPRAHILWIAARAALLSAIAGIALGSLCNLLLRNFLRHWMQSGHASPLATALATLLITLGTFLACLLPARRAATIHPVEALHYE